MRYIYLAGPMTGTRLDKINEWRKKVTHDLMMSDVDHVTTLWPTRGCEQNNGGEFTGVGTEPPTFTARDFYDVKRSDLVLFNFIDAPERVSIGSCIEIGWASALQIPILVATSPGNIHNNAMLVQLAAAVVPNIEELTDTAIHFLLPR